MMGADHVGSSFHPNDLPPSFRIVLALGASLFAISATAASPDDDPLQVTAPVIPSPEIPEAAVPGFRIARVTFEREFDSPFIHSSPRTVFFYLSYTQNDPRRTVISEMKVTAGDAPIAMSEKERLVLEIQQPLADHWEGICSSG